MSVNHNKISVEEYLSRMRSQIVLTNSQAEEIALKAFDEVSRKYVELLKQVKADKDKEIKDKEKELVDRVKTNLPNNKLPTTTGTVKEVPKKK